MDFSLKHQLPLSTAIRLGSALKPQAFGSFYQGGGSCALGAAVDAIGADIDRFIFMKYWPICNTANQPLCPECGRDADGRDECGDKDLVVHLNDFHKWDRLRIADFVEQIEQQSEPAGVVGEVVVHGV